MKTLITAWIVAMIVYLLTPVVMADEPAAQRLWQGRGVVGEVCVDVNQTDFDKIDEVLLWVVADGETTEWQYTAEMACVPVKFSRESAVYARYGKQQDVQVVADKTTSYISIELPF